MVLEEARVITAQDLLDIKSLSDPQISLDGRYVAVVETTIAKQSDGYQDMIHLFELSSGQRTTIQGNAGRLRAPRFSHDGQTLAWIRTTGDGEEAVCVATVTSIFDDAPTLDKGQVVFRTKKIKGCPEWSPQGHIYVVAITEATSEIKVYEDLHFKFDGVGLAKHKQSQVIRIRPQQAAGSLLWSCAGEVADLTVSADGGKLAFTLKQSPDKEFYINDIHLLDTQSGSCRRAMRSKGPVSALTFSPDGDRLAWVGHQGERWNDITETVYVTELETGEFYQAAPNFDRPASPYGMGDIRSVPAYSRIIFQQSGTGIWFLASDHGRASIYDLTIGGNPREAVQTTKRCISYFSAAKDGSFVFTAGSQTHPDALWLCREGVETALYDGNEELFRQLSVGEPELLPFTSSGGLTIESWLMLPPEAAGAKRPYPLILVIHGGPHNSYGYGFQMEFQTLCAAGFAVLYANPRGSQTYGQEFATAVVHDWGGEDYEDLMCAVDAAIGTGMIDAGRLGVTGYSYGGYMTNWIITHTNRFTAAATGGCVADLISMAGTSDVGPRFVSDEHGINVWGDAKTLWARSPIAHVKNVNTPCLVYHAEGDDRCPIGQSEEFFSALRGLGKEAVFVRYPGSSHLFATHDKPSLRVDKLSRIANWFVTKVPS